MTKGDVVFLQIILTEHALNIPNFLTMLRIMLLPAVVWRYHLGDAHGALAIYLAAMLTDVADGVIARRTHQVTALGKLLDPIADKLSLFTLLVLFARSGQISLHLVNLVLIKEAVLILGSLAALRMGIVVSALPVGKLTTLTFVVSTVCRFLSLRRLADWLLRISVMLSIAALIWYTIVLLKKIKMQKAIL